MSIRLQTNATATALLYDWGDGILYWEVEINGGHLPLSLDLRVFKDLVNQPLLLALQPNEPFSPFILRYTGSEPRRMPTALAAASACLEREPLPAAHLCATQHLSGRLWRCLLLLLLQTSQGTSSTKRWRRPACQMPPSRNPHPASSSS